MRRTHAAAALRYARRRDNAVSAAERSWDPVEALELAIKAYSYVARVLPPDATLEAIGRADRAVLEAEERQDLPAYEEALRKLCKAARHEAHRRAA